MPKCTIKLVLRYGCSYETFATVKLMKMCVTKSFLLPIGNSSLSPNRPPKKQTKKQTKCLRSDSFQILFNCLI